MPIWVEDENVGYARQEESIAEQANQHAHAEVAHKDLEDREDHDKDWCCQDLIGDLLGSQRRFGRSRLAMQMKRSQRPAKRPSRKSRRTDGSRAKADDPDATPGREEDAEPSSSGNSRSNMLAAGLKKKKKP